MNKWHYVKNKLPKKDGKYLVAIKIERDNAKNVNFVFLTEYSEASGFSFDELCKKRNDNTRVYAWFQFDNPPIHPASMISKENQGKHN